MWLLAAWSTVAADLWFIAMVWRIPRDQFGRPFPESVRPVWKAPVWCCYAVPRLAMNAIWALGFVTWLRIPWVEHVGAAMRIAVTLEAMWLLLCKPDPIKSGSRWRLSFAAMLGLGTGALSYFLAQSIIGQVRIGCVLSLTAIILLTIARPIDSFLMHQRHAAMMFVWMASAAMASFEGVKSGELGDAAALAVQAGCVVASAWIVKKG